MRPILLTGASGHLGKVVSRQLIDIGIPVLAVGRRSETLDRLRTDIRSPLLKTAVVDLAQPETVSCLVSQFGPVTRLIHLAAHLDANAPLSEHLSGNLGTTVSLVSGLRESLEQVVYLSSIEVYGMPRSRPMNEDHPTMPETYYGAGKLGAEKFLQIFGQERGATITNLRCSSIYGPGETIRRATTLFLKNAVEGKPIQITGDGREFRDYIYIEDAARAVLQSLQAEKAGVYNLGGNRPISIRELARLIINASGKNLAIEYTKRTKPKYDLALDNAKIFLQIGFEPKVSMEEGLAAEYETMLRAG